ncbi:MAG TPA: endonuclease/exonuclease/phosphatase family protein, partial [Rhabdochlamydiaceae bacterium]|nr:endonuclease/exonuclease/phosphatase family protein [Rhabdochlamydiaceae bacterium]
MSALGFTDSNSVVARRLYQLHGYLSAPNYRMLQYIVHYRNPLKPGFADNCVSVIAEIAYRLIAPVVLAAGVGYFYVWKALNLRQIGKITGKALVLILTAEAIIFLVHLAAYLAQRKKYIHVRGSKNAQEVSKESITLASWNIAAFPSGLAYARPIWQRFDKIVEKIRNMDADIVVLQECLVDSRLPEAFIEQFKDQYAHFFIHIGPHAFGPESGLLIMSKCAVSNFDFEFFTNRSSTQFNINRGFATLEAKAQRDGLPFAVIGTHMDARMDMDQNGHQLDNSIGSENRKKQLLQIQRKATQVLCKDQFVILAGDTNINMKDRKARQETGIESVLIHPFYVRREDDRIDPINGTCTDIFKMLWRGRISQKLEDIEWH